MAFRLSPGRDITENVREVGVQQIDRALKQLSRSSKGGKAVHETRKAMKRVRALLHLIRLALPKSDFRRDEARIKQIARSLSGVRDIQAMLETLTKLEIADETVAGSAFAASLRKHLEARCKAAEKDIAGSGTAETRALLRKARKALQEIKLKHDGFDALAAQIEGDYRKARYAFQRAYQIQEDEAFHDWRKYVQRHWRQLLLVTPVWPKALRPHANLARDLSETLGEDHDLYVLIHYVRNEGDQLGGPDELADFIAASQARQAALRVLAQDMGGRLLAEKPSSLAARLQTYWETAPRLKEHDAMEEEDEAAS